MALSDVELGMLSSLVYDAGLFSSDGEGATLAVILTTYKHTHSDLSEQQLRIIDYALADTNLAHTVLLNVDSYTERGSNAACLRGADGELYVVFQGTGTGEVIDGQATNSEWYTDALGLTEADTDPQVAAANYVSYVARRYGGDVTVTGHSNGANKAMYCAIICPYVKRAVAFDGQGFSLAFHNKYASEIDANSRKVTFYGQEGDYVGPLLKPLPIEKHYVVHGEFNTSDEFASYGPVLGWLAVFGFNHGADSLFTVSDDGTLTLVEGEPSWLTTEIEHFVNYLYNTYSEDELAVMAPLLGQILDSLLGTKGRTLGDLWNDPSLAAAWAAFVSALMLYEDLDELIAALVGGLGNAIDPEVAALLGGLDPDSLLHAIHSACSSLDPFGIIRDRFRKLVKRAARRVQAGVTGGASGNRYAVRDFTEAKRQELLSIVREVEAEPWFDPTRWDVWYRAERWFGYLTIQNYQHDMGTYYRKTIDVDGVTESQINTIFQRVEAASSRFCNSTVPHALTNALSDHAAYLKTCI